MDFNHVNIKNETSGKQVAQSNDETSQLKKQMNIQKSPFAVCIMQVPVNLRKGHEHIFLPEVVAFGPYHKDRKNYLIAKEEAMSSLVCYSKLHELSQVMGNLRLAICRKYTKKKAEETLQILDKMQPFLEGLLKYPIDLRQSEMQNVRELERIYKEVLGEEAFCKSSEALECQIREHIEELMLLYEDSFAFNAESFACNAKTFALDGCFLLKFAVSLTYSHASGDLETFHSLFHASRLHSRVGYTMRADMIKLESQLPLNLLVWLARFCISEKQKAEVFIFRLFYNVIFDYIPYKERKDCLLVAKRTFHKVPCGPRHILEWLHRIWLGWITQCIIGEPSSDVLAWEPCCISIPSASQLKTASISIRKGTRLLFKETPCGGILYLPSIPFKFDMQVVLGNLLAFEDAMGWALENESLQNGKTVMPKLVTRYVRLLISLIKTEEDVEILQKAFVLGSSSTPISEDVQSLSKICQQLHFEPHQALDYQLAEVTRCYASQWKQVATDFKNTYCCRPWNLIGAFALGITVGAAILQSVQKAWHLIFNTIVLALENAN